MMSNERPEPAETPAWYGRRADSINTELAADREPRQDLDTMGRAEVGTRRHRDRARQLAIVVRSLAPRGRLN